MRTTKQRGNPRLIEGTEYQFQGEPGRESYTATFTLKVTPQILEKLRGVPRNTIRDALAGLVGEE